MIHVEDNYQNSNFGFNTACLSDFLIVIRMWGSGLLRLFIIHDRGTLSIKSISINKSKSKNTQGIFLEDLENILAISRRILFLGGKIS